jgi:hypothetical protein
MVELGGGAVAGGRRVVRDNSVSDTTWAALCATRDDQQVIEVLVLIGFYRMNAGILNSLGAQPDPGMPSFGTSRDDARAS